MEVNKHTVNKGVGKTYTMPSDKQDTLEYIERIDKIDFVRGVEGSREELTEFVQYVYNKLRGFRYGLYLLGVDVGYKRTQWLINEGYITTANSSGNKNIKKHTDVVRGRYVDKFIVQKNGGVIAKKATNQYTVDYEYEEEQGDTISANDLHLQNTMRTYKKHYEISRKYWEVKDVFNMPDEIYDMITIINRGWQYFERSDRKWTMFNEYRMQAYTWMKNLKEFDPSATEDMQIAWLTDERARCLTNSLYLANRHLWYKDADDFFEGEKKFTAWKAQEVVLFLIDLGYSLIIGKLRQIGLTTVIGGVMALRTMISRNFYIKMVAQKGDKSEEIFEHKVKYPISKADDHMKPTIPNWSTDKVKFGFSSGKGKKESTSSIFEVTAPAEDAINAGTPKVTLLDEIGFNKMFGAIISQGRPTMFKLIDGKMRMTKQVIAWGTGGKTGGAGAPMEVEWKASKEAFANRNFRHGLIPLFLNFYAKPGHTDDFYIQEKAFYYSKKKQPGEEDPKIVFHQSFPITEDDMFLQSSDTVISIASINLQIERIEKERATGKSRVYRGYFEPVFNLEKPRGDDAYIPYEIIGTRWVPADQEMIDEDSPFACIHIYEHPDLSYKNLYYKGTDPIFTSSGHSKLASTVKRADNKKTVAKIFYKSSDYRFEFLQSLLLNLHYSRAYANRKVGIKELLEFNVGGEYYNMCRDLGYGSIFTGNKMLPQNLQTQSINIGIDKKGNKSISIVNRLEEMLIDTAGMIDSLEFWTQLKTFVRKGTATGYKYEPENKKIHFDDEIDSEVYAKINVDAHSHIPVVKEEEGVEERQHAKKLRYYYDEHGNLSLGTLSKAAAAKRAFNGIHSQ